MSAASPAHAGTKGFVAVNSIQALPAAAAGGSVHRLRGLASNGGSRAATRRVTVRLLHRGMKPRVVGRVKVRVAAHATRRFAVSVRVPSGLGKGSYQLAACAPRGVAGGFLTCATGGSELQVGGGDAVRGVVAAREMKASAADDTCSPGAHTLAPPGDRVYPEAGNGGYKSVHTDTNLVYDAVQNTYLPGTYVDLTILPTQCLTDFSFDFERTNGVTSTTTPGPNMTVGSVTVNDQPATFAFVQPTYPGDPNGQNDPDPAAHATGNGISNGHGGYMVSAANPNPPACAPTGTAGNLQNLPCPANKLVVTPGASVPSGTTLKVRINFIGRPGVHIDGDGSREGFFRTGNGEGGFVTTEPIGTESWMPLNNHPTAKPTYDFTTTTNSGRTSISNGVLVSKTDNAADPSFPSADSTPGPSVTWKWHSPEPVQNYLVENSIGLYDNGYAGDPQYSPDTGAKLINGILFYEFQSSSIAPQTKLNNKAIADTQADITQFQSTFNGPFPFSSNGVIVGTAAASFEEEMQTKITFGAGQLNDAGTLAHENMHQWWGDNVAESLFRFTFLKEGMANVGSSLAAARTAGLAAGAPGSAAYETAFDNSLISQFNSRYNSTNLWASAPSDPSPGTLFNQNFTYNRPATSYLALRQIIGRDTWVSLLKATQAAFAGGNISEAQMEAQYKKFIPNQSTACAAKLDQFFIQWWDTAYTTGNKPQITGPGLNGPGFYDATGACSVQNPVLAAPAISGTQVGDTYGGATRPALTFAAPDGVRTQYNLDGADFVDYAGPVTLADGAHTLVYRSIDAQGNQTQDTTATPFKVDATAPVTTATVAGGTPIAGGYVQVPDKAVVTLAATDAMSTVSKIEYSVDGGAFQTYTAPFTVNGSSLHVVSYRATDSLGNVEATKTLNVIIDPTASTSPSGTVPATLSLALGNAATFQPFQAGVGKDYAASTTATVLSTAGAAALSVSDPSATATGRLVNGAFSLAAPLQAMATSAAGTGSAFAPLSTTAGNPLTLLSYTGPISNDLVTINLKQTIGQNEALRTGTYAKTLTFTLSTMTP